MFSAIANDNPLFVLLDGIKGQLGSVTWGTLAEIKRPGLILDIEYKTDEYDDEFATVSFTLPDDVFAEIEDGTYGTLQGFRIYREDADGNVPASPSV